MKQVLLTRGKVALVDDVDFARVNQFKWCAIRDAKNGRWYATRTVRVAKGKWTSQMMHRFIMGLKRGDPHQVDHKDRVNTLDNRRQNLRIATSGQNQRNQSLHKNNTSGLKGVSWDARLGKWKATIRVNRRLLHLGYFATRTLAAAARDAAALKYHGAFAVTNSMLKTA